MCDDRRNDDEMFGKDNGAANNWKVNWKSRCQSKLPGGRFLKHSSWCLCHHWRVGVAGEGNESSFNTKDTLGIKEKGFRRYDNQSERKREKNVIDSISYRVKKTFELLWKWVFTWRKNISTLFDYCTVRVYMNNYQIDVLYSLKITSQLSLKLFNCYKIPYGRITRLNILLYIYPLIQFIFIIRNIISTTYLIVLPQVWN